MLSTPRATPPLAELIPLRELARRLPPRRAGRPVHVSCLWRWVTAGVRGHKLPVWKIGATPCSTEAALLAFISATSQVAEAPAPAPRAETAEMLEKAGIHPAKAVARGR